MRMINAATEFLPKLFLFGLIIVQSGAASTASISSYVSLGLVLANVVTMCDCVMAEFVPEIASVAPPAVGAATARPSTIIVLKGLIDRLVSAEESTPEDIELAWREAFAGDDEKLLEMQLCLLLSDIVCLKERERFFRASVVETSAVITFADTFSDVNVIALYWGSAFGTILMIQFIVAVVSGGSSSPPPPRFS